MVERTEMLIEGFDAEKLAELRERDNVSKGWQEVYGSYQNEKILQATVEGVVKVGAMDCAVIYVDKVKGIIPVEFFGVETREEMEKYLWNKVAFVVHEYDREGEIFTGSRIKAKEIMARITLRKIEVDDVIPMVVRRVTGLNLYGDIGGIDVKVPIDEVRYGWINNLHDEYEEGDHLFVKVVDIKYPEAEKVEEIEGETIKKNDSPLPKVIVSAKQAKENPWDNIEGSFERYREYAGEVSGVAEFGVFVKLADGVASVSPHLKFEHVEKGDKVVVRVERIDVEKERIRSRIVRVL